MIPLHWLICGSEEGTVDEQVFTQYLKLWEYNKKFIWELFEHIPNIYTSSSSKDPFSIIYWLSVKSFTASFISFGWFFFFFFLQWISVQMGKCAKKAWNRSEEIVGKIYTIWFAWFLLLLPGVRGESKSSIYWGFQWREALSNPHFIVPTWVYERGGMRPLHCNCLMCFSAVHHQSLARYLTEL